MKQQAGLLLAVLRDPSRLRSLSAQQWDTLLPQARAARVLGRLATLIDGCNGADELPAKVAEHLLAERRLAQQHARVMRYEVGRIERAMAQVDGPIVLLKGAAYVMAELPPARGRLFADVDIMVPHGHLPAAERAMLDAGWQFMKTHPYDQRYYRRWMHELPPLEHAQRKTVVDVHHTILPLTGRVRLDPASLFTHARPLPNSRLSVLCPADMILHSAAHMFQDGEIDGSVRDLLDLGDLLHYFGDDKTFWDSLSNRADTLNLQRPLAYALRYTRQLLGTPVPESASAAAERGAPRWQLRVMDSLVARAVVPDPVNQVARSARLARFLLYIRSHWLRMPPLLLGKHLLHKTLRRANDDEPQARPERR